MKLRHVAVLGVILAAVPVTLVYFVGCFVSSVFVFIFFL